MCGIVGTAGDWPADLVGRMNYAQAHRGPDDAGEYRDRGGEVALAMRRLSILDIAGGHQPMANEDGSVWIVFNGEIYNAPELRPELARAGHTFRTASSDTETLVHLYEQHGPAMLGRLNGMFAFVIYDRARGTLFAARDRMGIKPLYYWHAGRRLAFASELKSLLQIGALPREIDMQGLWHYMTLLYLPDSASIVRGVSRLPAGHCFTYQVERGEMKVWRYWAPSFEPDGRASEEEWAERLRAELGAAVGRWSLSDVPVACALSGGVDSAAVVGLLAERGAPRLRTFTLGFRGEEAEPWNEVELARQVARRWETEHEEIWVDAEDLLDDLVQMVWHLDEPYGGGLPSWYVFRAMARHVKVAMTGTGGDELFGNYGKYDVYENSGSVRAALRLRSRAPWLAGPLAALAEPAAAVGARLPARGGWLGRGGTLARLPETLREPFGRFYYASAVYMSDARKRGEVFRAAPPGVVDTAAFLQQLYDDSGAPGVRDGLAAVDLRTQLAEEFLLMTDRFSMAHALEARTPLLDHRLVELAFRIPAQVRSRPGDLKYLLKRACQGLIPPDVLRGRKRGFVIPVERWLRGALRPLAERMLAPERLARQGIFAPSFFERTVRPHLEGRADQTWQVWSALMFQIWHVVFVEEHATSAPTFSWRDLC